MQFNGNTVELADVVQFRATDYTMPAGAPPVAGWESIGVVQEVQENGSLLIIVCVGSLFYGSDLGYVSDPAQLRGHWKPAPSGA